MIWFKRPRKYLYQLLLNRKVKEHNYRRKFLYLRSVKKIGILFYWKDINSLTAIDPFIQEMETKNKSVFLLGFIKKQDKKQPLDLPNNVELISNKELNWLTIPQGQKVNRFINQEYDLLLNCYLSENLALQYISALSHAKFRVGIYLENNIHCNDFMIDLKKEKSIPQFFEQVKYYLKKIRNPKQEPVHEE